MVDERPLQAEGGVGDGGVSQEVVWNNIQLGRDTRGSLPPPHHTLGRPYKIPSSSAPLLVLLRLAMHQQK
ncbi:hypothetical protein E2C01_082765 [Portunus trituberculatus]|uniref:Uncharacterized protein n=1 Tax=Portunus trituberculatus TaxID=210409 RepID=A0A5B7IZB8_PORTR|nr:hypothetical protein [Portunus trituberculatus]